MEEVMKVYVETFSVAMDEVAAIFRQVFHKIANVFK